MILKVFSKKGRAGSTSSVDGECVAKSSELVELYGSLDELNSFIGWSIEAIHKDYYLEVQFRPYLKQLYQIQRDLFALGQQLSLKQYKQAAINEQHVAQLEREINAISDKLPPAKSFILPGGGEVSSRLHIVRTICRRAERAAFRAVATNKGALIAGSYLNRLSDWFFVAARFAAFTSSVEELTV
jgi:cob(I)alamin adenosyltransferase